MRTLAAIVRTAIGVPSMALVTIVLTVYIIVMAHLRPSARSVNTAARLWGRASMFFVGGRVDVEGLEHIDRTKSYVFISNHASNLDPPIHLAIIPVPIRFLAKQELFKIPLFGTALRAINMVETDRAAGRQAHMKINRQVAKVVQAGQSLIIYPEGTRNRSGDVADFKKGAFRIAVDNNLPVVPMAISGTAEAWRPGSKLWKGGPVKVVIHEPIPTEGLAPIEITALKQQAFEVVASTYEKIRQS